MNKRVYFNKKTAGSAGFFPLQIPRFLVVSDSPAYAELSRISNHAKMLYALLLDRLSTNDMSVAFLENPWHKDKNMPVNLQGGYDEQGNAYVYFSAEDLQEQLSLSPDCVPKVLEELEAQALIQISSQAEGEPRRIYPLTLAPAKSPLAS